MMFLLLTINLLLVIYVSLLDLVVVVDGLAATSGGGTTTTTNNENINNNIIDKYLKPYQLELYEFPITTTNEKSGDGNVVRGIRTLIDRKPGEILIKIPLDDTITISSAIRISSSKNNNEQQQQESRSTTVKFLSNLLLNNNKDEKNNKNNLFSEEQKLALALLLLLRNNNNQQQQHSSAEYISSVLESTKHYGIWNMPSNLFQQHLCLPRCYKEFFQATRNSVLDFITNVQQQQQQQQIILSSSSSSSEENDDDINDNEITGISNDELQWAFSMVRSRSLSVPELEANGDELAIIPGLDMFNHDFNAGTTLQLVVTDDEEEEEDDDDDDTNNKKYYWTLISSKSYSKGDQIYLNYGSEKDYWKLLQTYGFSVADDNNNNPNNKLIFWTWEDLLDAVSQCRPNMFTSKVCYGLLHHPQLTKYKEMTEQRAIFSFDYITGTPRTSLQTGLSLMMNLASQLGFPNDDNLPNEVLQKLIDNRYNELQECRRLRRNLEEEEEEGVEIPLEWKPLWDSIQQVLHDEESYLQNAISKNK